MDKSTEKLDGAVALIMALDRAIRNEGYSGSVYNNREINFREKFKFLLTRKQKYFILFLWKQKRGDKMTHKILKLFTEQFEKQDLLSKLTSKEFLHEYGYSEIHCIDAIGKLEQPNVTKIANHLNMTRGAISKITKKQLSSGLIESYSLETNRKEIYFKLTAEGQKLFDEHERRHATWERRDEAFFDQYPEETIEVIEKFMEEFNQYLKDQIEYVEGKR